MAKKTSKQIFKKIFVVLSGSAFIIFSVAGVLRMMSTETAVNNATQQEELSPEALLLKEAEGYKMVLEREPENRFALEKLAEIYLRLNDLNAALPLIEKLNAIQPDNERYKQALAVIKKGLAESNNPQTNQEGSTEIVTEDEKK